MGRPKKARGGHGTHAQRTAAAAAAAAAEFYPAGQAYAAAAGILVPPALAYGGDGDEEDEEEAEFRREAAELLKQRQHRAALPGNLSQKQLDNAVNAFIAQTGVQKSQAEDALLSTAEQYCKDFEEWFNQASMWLCTQSEVQDEAAKLKQAMEVSLREQEEARKAEQSGPPLANLSEERLRKRFQGSVMLERLGAVLPGSLLFSDRLPYREKVKNKLVGYLQLESDCNKWWPGQGTQRYFTDTAERFCLKLKEASSSSCSKTGVLPAAAGAAGSSLAAITAGTAQPQQPLGAGALNAMPGDPSSSSPAAQDPGPGPAAAVGEGPAGGAMGAAAGMAAPDAAAAGAAADGAGSCRPSPEAEVSSEPCSAAAACSTGDGEGGGCTGGQRASKRRRQAPARYRSPSPAASADGAGSRKRQQHPSPEDGQPAKRQASLDCLAAAAKDSSTAWRSDSSSPAPLEAPAGQPAAAAGGAATGQARLGVMPDSMQQQDRGVLAAAQRLSGKLPPLPPPPLQQQHNAAAQLQPQGHPAAGAAAAACDDRGGDPLRAYLPATECLSELFDGELQLLRHHVYTMPEKWGALPAIFQLAEEQQEADGDDSDVELVDERQPAGGQDIPQSPELPAPPPPLPPAAAAVLPGAAAASFPEAWQAGYDAAAAAAAAAAVHNPSLGAAVAAMPAGGLYLAGRAGPGAAHAAAMDGFAQHFPQAHTAEQFEYRASTNEQGTLVIEID